jgi:transcriptional regulator with XRE-family HTH domain
MQFQRRIDAIEKRAATLNFSLPEICSEADVEYSTIWRWRQPGANPKQRTLDRLLGKLERHLEKKEGQVRRLLGRRTSARLTA